MIYRLEDNPAEKLPEGDAPPLQPWIESLPDLAGRLERVARSTEAQFLTMGEKLQEFYLRAGEIAGSSREISALIAGEEINLAMNGLKGILERMSHHFSGEDDGEAGRSGTLEGIKGCLDSIDDPLSGFTRIYKTLRMLGISTKIESARLGETGAGFSSLADDVSVLSVQVQDKVRGIVEHKAELTATIGRTLNLVREIGAEQMADVGMIMAGARQSLEELNGINCRCAEAAGFVESSAAEVSRNVGEVVMSMQFHDIVRQQVEHVCDSLNELRHRLMEPGESQKPGEGDEYAETFQVCTLQAAQLRHAREEFALAVARIMANLREVGSRQALIADASRRVAGSSREDGSFFNDLEEGLASVTALLSESAGKNRELSAVVATLADTVGGISVFVNDIETIGEEIELIALNARVKASRAGSEGAALGVLAEAVQGLSLEAMRQSGAVSGALKAVADGAGELCARADQRIAGLESEEEGISGEIAWMLKTIRRVNGDLARSLERMDELVVALTADITGTTQGITVQAEFESVIGDVIGRLDAIAAEARKLCRGDWTPPAADATRQLSDRYTMQSERVIHGSVAGTGFTASPAAVAEPVGLTIPAQPEDSGPGLDDNIEFF